MARRTRTYVAFDATEDIRYYRLMQAWTAHDDFEFDFNDAHELTTIRQDSIEDSIKASLRERMKNSKILVVLVGEKTKNLRKYVPWEIEIALKADLPIIVVNLNKTKRKDDTLCPELLKSALAIHIPYGPKILQHAIENWPSSHIKYRAEKETGPYYYLDSTYTSLGLP
ncbi:TIR domain-containing protein [bacterium]|nr:TIR domain-containing protein [bacterium]